MLSISNCSLLFSTCPQSNLNELYLSTLLSYLAMWSSFRCLHTCGLYLLSKCQDVYISNQDLHLISQLFYKLMTRHIVGSSSFLGNSTPVSKIVHSAISLITSKRLFSAFSFMWNKGLNIITMTSLSTEFYHAVFRRDNHHLLCWWSTPLLSSIFLLTTHVLSVTLLSLLQVVFPGQYFVGLLVKFL